MCKVWNFSTIHVTILYVLKNLSIHQSRPPSRLKLIKEERKKKKKEESKHFYSAKGYKIILVNDSTT